ncbi:hypothetical protein BDV3_002265 [Batrachochytrium dendrobatidis]|nr:hypothetical protein QVD99_008633 [Batrachochytrium dendrobatidis]
MFYFSAVVLALLAPGITAMNILNVSAITSLKTTSSHNSHINSSEPPSTSSMPFTVINRAVKNGSSIVSTAGIAQTLFMTINVGTPPVTLNVQIDTGSSTFWIVSTLCNAGNGCTPAVTANAFNPTKSRSLLNISRTSVKRQYGDGTKIECTIVTDLLVIAGISIPNQNICAATSINLASLGLDGLIGLGPPRQSDPADVFENIRSVINIPRVSFYYDQSVNSLEATQPIASSGEITFGTPNPARYTGNFTWLPTIPNMSQWAVGIDYIIAGGQTVVTTQMFLFDTGTTLIYLDQQLFPFINTAMGGISKQGGIYELDCSLVHTLQPITFSLGGIGARLTLSWNMQYFTLDNTRCISIFTTSPSQSNIFGGIFLQHFYTSFDYNESRIGLAAPVNNNKWNDADILPRVSKTATESNSAAKSTRLISTVGWESICAISMASVSTLVSLMGGLYP